MKRPGPFLKSLPQSLERIRAEKFSLSGCDTINFYAMDESRFGLLTVQRRCLTARGIKPLVPYQHHFKNFYLFGAYSPVDGDHFTLEFPYCNSVCFEQYLKEFSAYRPQEFKIVLLDNGAFHKAKTLVIPSNVALLFLPPYSPELNPAERIWRSIKDKLANLVFDGLDRLSDKVCEIVRQLSKESIHKLVGWELYTNCVK